MQEPLFQHTCPSVLAIADSDESAVRELMDMVYAELRALAATYFRDQQHANTLQPTALVHETFLKISERTGSQFNDRAHFFAICAVAMRSILADHARRRRAAKRGGDWDRVPLTGISSPSGTTEVEALALDEALTELADRSERQARIVEYRFFSGMTVDDIARVLSVSRSTVEADWRMARAWLTVRLNHGITT